MIDWRDQVTEERPGVSLGGLDDGDQLVVEFLDEGHLTQTRHDEALEVGVKVREFPDNYESMNGNPLEEGEEYNLMTSSSRFQYALKEFADTLPGARAAIVCQDDPNDPFARGYTVEPP